MSTQDSVAVLIECARRLRGIAESLAAADLKAQIVDELLRLHEIREKLLVGGNNGTDSKSEPAIRRILSEPAKLLADADAKSFTFDADDVTETYDLHLGVPAESTTPPADAGAASTPPATVAAARPAPGSKSHGKPGSAPADQASAGAGDLGETSAVTTQASRGLTDEQRLALAEQRILELEPMHQAALRKMNDILTDEQQQAKAAATRAGIKAGRKGRELQQSVMAALHLTPDQQQRMAAARKELLEVRQAIGRQVEGLLSKEQLEQMLQQFTRRHGG